MSSHRQPQIVTSTLVMVVISSINAKKSIMIFYATFCLE
jgi:hypothetical protein